MATNYTPHQTGEALDASTLNSRLEELDNAIEDVKDGSATLSAPTIADFSNSQHDHEDAAGGGKLTLDAIDSSALAANESPVADGSGGWVAQSVVMPTGVMVVYAASTAPIGWLLCDGSAVSRSTYSNLFALIGTSYGTGDGSTTFNLPDLRGRYPLGADNMGGVSANRVTSAQADVLGGASGAETHTLTVPELPSHSHSIPAVYTASGVQTPAQVIQQNNNNTFLQNTTGSAGSGNAHNNMPPYQTVNYIIKA